MSESFIDDLRKNAKTKEEYDHEKEAETEKNTNKAIVEINDLIPLIQQKMIEQARCGKTIQTNTGKVIEFPIYAGCVTAHYQLDYKSSEMTFPSGVHYGDLHSGREWAFFDTLNNIFEIAETGNVIAITLGEYKKYRDVYYAIGKLNENSRFRIDFKWHKGFLSPSYEIRVKMCDAEKDTFNEFKMKLKKVGIESDYSCSLTYSDYLHPYSENHSFTDLINGIVSKNKISNNDYYSRHCCDFIISVNYLLKAYF